MELNPRKNRQVMRKKKGKVETVRQKGGDCLESVLQRVKVVKEDPCKRVEIVEYTDPAEVERLAEEERRVAAEARGQEAGRRVLQQQWIEEKLAREEKERRESVRLMEMLRAARVISHPKQDPGPCGIHNNQDATDNNAVDVCSNSQYEAPDQSDRSKQVRKKVLIDPGARNHENISNNPPPLPTVPRPRPKVVISSKPRTKQFESSRNRIHSSESLKQTVRESSASSVAAAERNRIQPSVPSRTPVTEASISSKSGLSTIAEVTENVSLSDRAERLALSDDNTSRSMSPFPQSEITTARPDHLQMPNLDAVKMLIDRVKLQGEKLQLSEKHFLNISNQSEVDGNKEPQTVQNSKVYKVNEDFLQKVLDFSTSISVLSSDESSSFRPLALPSSKYKGDPVPSEKIPTASINPTFFHHSIVSPIAKAVKKQSSDRDNSRKSDDEVQTYLRQYIVQLLQMKHEEIAELSVTTDASDKSSFDAILTKQRLHWQSKIQTSSDLSSSTLTSSSSSRY